MIGIIGGSGIYDPDMFENTEEKSIKTPYGSPSDSIVVGRIGNKKVAFLPRHGRNHSLPPHSLNYRANIYAMEKLGVTRIISPCAVGSLREDYSPGTIVAVDQFIDFTKKRNYTYHDGGEGKTVYHVSTADPFCPELRRLIKEKCEELHIPMKGNGTYICIEGPRYSTRAESKMFRQFADVIGMTLVPEVVLAREKEICYSSTAMITDYDVWAEEPVDTEEVLQVMKKNQEKIKSLLSEVIPAIPEERSCECGEAMENAGI